MTAATEHPRAPANRHEAVTRASVVSGSRGREAQQAWYYACVRDMLGESGCPAGKIDDVAHDLLLERMEAICRGYDRGKGRFRPYLYRCVSNYWRDRLRARRGRGSDLHCPLDHAEPVARREETAGDAPPRPGLGELHCFLDRLFARFMRDMARKRVGFFLLRDWCVHGRDIEDAIRANGLRLAPAYARRLRNQAIAAFAEELLDPEALAEIAAAAEHDGPDDALDSGGPGLLRLLRWPSEAKRLGVMARLLRHLYRAYEQRGLSFDEL